MQTLFKKTYENFKTTYHASENPVSTEGGRRLRQMTPSRLDGYRSEKVHYFTIDKFSLEKEDFLKEYGNLMCEVINDRRTVVVESDDDKVRVSIYYHSKLRKVGKKYFATTYDRFYLTYNKKTNNFYTTNIYKGYGQRARRSVRCNSFNKIERLRDIKSEFSLNNNEVNQLYGSFINGIGGKWEDKDSAPDGMFFFKKTIIDLFVKHNNIKGPDHTDVLMNTLYPGKKLLKKNGYNIVHAVLDGYGLKSKYFISLLNNYRIQTHFIVKYTQMLGLKYVKTINKNFFENERLPYYDYVRIKNWEMEPVAQIYDDIDDFTRKNIVKVINDFSKDNNVTKGYRELHNYNRNLTGLIDDHLTIIRKLKKFLPDTRFRATTYDEFVIEHNNLTNQYDLYRNSEEIFYLYGEEFSERINHTANGVEYVLLSDEMEYVQESVHQSNCVRTYIDKFNSIIVSVRKGNDRVTTEFNYDGVCIQKRGRFNENVPEHMVDNVIYLEMLIKQMKSEGILKPAKIKVFNKITKQYKILEQNEKKEYRRSGNELFDELMDDELDFMLI